MDRSALNLLDIIIEILAQLGLAEYDEQQNSYVVHASGDEHLKLIQTLLETAGKLDEYDKMEVEGFEERLKDDAFARLHKLKGKKIVH